MQPHVCDAFDAIPWKEGPEEYNFSQFGTKQLADDVRHTIATHGVRPGRLAPDFELPLVGGGRVALHELRGRPVLMRFVSFT